jgi:hypothetical protein
MSNEPIPPEGELRAIESALGSLAPARARLDRDRVMFLAGQASARPRRAISSRLGWPAIAAGLGLVAAGEAALLAHRPPLTPNVVERVVVVREPVPAGPMPVRDPAGPPAAPLSEPAALGRTAYDRLALQVARYGLDALPPSPAAAWDDPQPRLVPARQLLQEEIRETLEPGDPS